MLVLSRKTNQQIIVGENITITILKIRGNTVRIGIEAPKDIHVMRGELEPARTSTAVQQPLTVEFKSGASDSSPANPSLRIVTDDTATDDNTSCSDGTHRLRELVTRISNPESQ